MSDTKLKIQESQRTPSRITTKIYKTWYIIYKLPKIKDKENIEKCWERRGHTLPIGKKIRITSDFASETMEGERV